MKLLGKPIAEQWLTKLAKQVGSLNRAPRLHIVQVGADPGSGIYVKRKLSAAKKIGVDARVILLPAEANTQTVLDAILEAAKQSDGIIVQLPLPPGINQQAVLDAVPSALDVDALSTQSTQRLADNFEGAIVPATPRAIIEILKGVKTIRDLRVAIVGAGVLVGRPLSYALVNEGAKVTPVDIDTPNPTELTKQADVIVSAVGKPGLITAEHVKSGQIVIDAGFNFIDGKVVGDVDAEAVEPIVDQLTPVPGGVGAVTVVALLANVIDATVRRVNDRR